MGKMLPLDVRKSSFDRIKNIAKDYDVKIHICGCKNCDITTENCYITRQQEPFIELFNQQL